MSFISVEIITKITFVILKYFYLNLKTPHHLVVLIISLQISQNTALLVDGYGRQKNVKGIEQN